MDESIKEPVREVDKDFLMSIESSLNIAGRGTVVTGTVEQGKAKINDDVHMIGIRRKTLDYAEAGDNVGVLLRGVTKE